VNPHKKTPIAISVLLLRACIAVCLPTHCLAVGLHVTVSISVSFEVRQRTILKCTALLWDLTLCRKLLLSYYFFRVFNLNYFSTLKMEEVPSKLR
jgi:hypothetical protein